MGDMRQPTALVTEKHMDAATFAYLSDDTYTSQEVEEETQVSGGGAECTCRCREG